MSEDKALGLNKITMYTTRPLRSGEAEGREYHFVDDDTAKRLENENKIIEIRCYDTVFGVWKYFTADDGQIDLASGKRYIVIGTLEAYDKFCEYYGNEHIMPIYIEVDDGVAHKGCKTRDGAGKSALRGTLQKISGRCKGFFGGKYP